MSVIASHKSVLLSKFLSLGRRDLPRKMTSREAEAYRLGLKHGYGEGIKDGVDLGVDVGLNSLLSGSEVETIEA